MSIFKYQQCCPCAPIHPPSRRAYRVVPSQCSCVTSTSPPFHVAVRTYQQRRSSCIRPRHRSECPGKTPCPRRNRYTSQRSDRMQTRPDCPEDTFATAASAQDPLSRTHLRRQSSNSRNALTAQAGAPEISTAAPAATSIAKARTWKCIVSTVKSLECEELDKRIQSSVPLPLRPTTAFIYPFSLTTSPPLHTSLTNPTTRPTSLIRPLLRVPSPLPSYHIESPPPSSHRTRPPPPPPDETITSRLGISSTIFTCPLPILPTRIPPSPVRCAVRCQGCPGRRRRNS